MPDEEELKKAMTDAEREKINPEKMLEKLENAQKKIKILKTERNELLKTNRKLVSIAQELESALSKHQSIDNSYNLDSHSANVNQPEVDINKIDREIHGVVEAVRNLRNLKNEQ